MKIAYLVNQYPMASQTFIRREICELENQGFEVERFALQRWADTAVDEQDRAEASKTRYAKDVGAVGLLWALVWTGLRRPLLLTRALLLSLRCWMRSDKGLVYHVGYLAEACVIRDWLEEAGVEHVHVHFASNSTDVAMLSQVLGGPGYSIMVHGPEEFDRAMYLSLEEKVSRSTFVATISSFARSQIFRWCSASEWSKVNIIRCGLDAAFLECAVSDPPDVARLISVGRLCEQKGQQLLVEAAGRLVREGLAFELILIGDGEMRPQIEAKIREHGLEDCVTITGWATNDEVKRQLESARALVLPSFAEGLPVAIMEALALNRPVLTTYIAGIPELLEHGENGWLVPAGDLDALTGTLREVLETPAERLAQMARAGRSAVLERHDVRREAQVLGGLLRASGGRG